MNRLMRSMLLQACSCGGKQATWQIVQHVLMTGSSGDIEDIIEFVHEYPEKWPSDFRSKILAMEVSKSAELEILERQRLQEQLVLQRQQEERQLSRLAREAKDALEKADNDNFTPPLDHQDFYTTELLHQEPAPT